MKAKDSVDSTTLTRRMATVMLARWSFLRLHAHDLIGDVVHPPLLP